MMRFDFSKSLLQVREFVKDLWWRNRSEDELARLSVLQKKFDLMKRYSKSRSEIEGDLP